MRINKFLAQATGISRRAADVAIAAGRVLVNGRPPVAGQQISDQDTVTLDGRRLSQQKETMTVLMNKPAGYVVSRNGQGSQTIYDLLPPKYHSLKPVGRLDKDSSGLLLLTNDGNLAHQLTHPRFAKQKVYEVTLDKPLLQADERQIGQGVQLEDGPSRLQLKQLSDDRHWQVTMTEGRNRQIRRTFAAMGYRVTELHRTQFGPYKLKGLVSGRLLSLNGQSSDHRDHAI